VTVHGPTSGLGNFDEDEWQLFHTDVDRAEAHDLANQHPEKLKQLIDAWFEEAEKYDVLPLDDRLPYQILADPRPQPEPDRDTFVYYPDTADVPESVAANTRGRSFKILAEVDLTSPDAEGVIFAHGSRFGGHALFLKEQKLWYVYNFLGIPPEQQFVSGVLEPGKHVLGTEFVKEGTGEHGEALGTTNLYVDEEVAASGPMRTQQAQFTLCGDGLCVGRDSADSVSKEYASPARFKGGTILQVEINVGGDHYVDLERHAAAMMARE
jgi:arylsulfatase